MLKTGQCKREYQDAWKLWFKIRFIASTIFFFQSCRFDVIKARGSNFGDVCTVAFCFLVFCAVGITCGFQCPAAFCFALMLSKVLKTIYLNPLFAVPQNWGFMTFSRYTVFQMTYRWDYVVGSDALCFFSPATTSSLADITLCFIRGLSWGLF